jgi:protein-tyrosine phosphatase
MRSADRARPDTLLNVTVERHLDWDGCFNARDLGGFRTADGRETRRGAVVRSDCPDRLTTAGWSALRAHGIRTIVDLRDDAEREAGADLRAAELATVRLPLEDLADSDFWEQWWRHVDTPDYYGAALGRWPNRFAAVVAAVARARPGGVLIHCAVGRDRTGLVTALLLALVGVAPEDIAADYELSAERLRPLYADEALVDTIERAGKRIGARIRELGASIPDTTAVTASAARRAPQNISDRATILAALASLDVEAYLRAGDLSDEDLAAVRVRLVGSAVERAAGSWHAHRRHREVV